MKKLFPVILLSLLFLPACKKDSNQGCIDKSKIRDGGCLTIYDPVCGCNGKTYSNSCEAKNAGLTKWKEGECKQ